MIETLDQMKAFLTWARENGVRAVKFSETTPRMPVDVVFDGAPFTGTFNPSDPVAHAEYRDNDGQPGAKPEELTDEELFGPNG